MTDHKRVLVLDPALALAGLKQLSGPLTGALGLLRGEG